MPNACPLNPHPGGPLAYTSCPASASPRHGDSSLKMTELVNRQRMLARRPRGPIRMPTEWLWGRF